MEEKTNFLNSKQVSELLGINRRTVQRLTKQGKIKGIRVGKLLKYKKYDIDQYFVYGTNYSKKPALNFVEDCKKPALNFVEDCKKPALNFVEDCKKPAEMSYHAFERRTYPRINSDLDCIFSIDLRDKRNNLCGTIRNLSAGGAFMSARDTDVSIDDPVDINFILDKSEMNIKGRVVRKSGAGFGVIFRSLDRGCRNEIIKYVG